MFRLLGGLWACLGLASAAAAQPLLPAPPSLQPPATTSPIAPAPRPTADPTPGPALPPPPPLASDSVIPPPMSVPYPQYGLAPCADCGPWGQTLCGSPGRVWVSAEYLYWVMEGAYLPPLVTAAPAGTPRGPAGALFQPTTAILFGNERVNNDWQSGFRLTAGAWLDDCQMAGIGGEFFVLSESEESFTSPRGPGLIFARPFINALTNAQDTQLVNFPGVADGSVTATARTNLIGGGAHFIRNLGCDPCGRLDLTLGYRYLNLEDELTFAESLTAADGAVFTIAEQFRSTNAFHGFPIGLNWERRFSHWFVGAKASVALGWTSQEVVIAGATAIRAPGAAAPQTFAGGLLAQSSNIGRHETDEFTVVPEAGVRLGAQVTERLRAFVSYNALYWSRVARVGEQVDLRVNPNLIPPPVGGGLGFPAFTPNRGDFWVQGAGLGIEYRF